MTLRIRKYPELAVGTRMCGDLAPWNFTFARIRVLGYCITYGTRRQPDQY